MKSNEKANVSNPAAAEQEQVLITAYKTLKEAIHFLPAKDHKFASDMLKAFEQKVGHGSASQQYWLQQMAKKAASGQKEETNNKEKLGGFEKIYSLLSMAKQSLKNPKILLQLADGSELMLYISGKNSVKPGVINLTDGKPYGQSKWYGRIFPDGIWEQPKNYVPVLVDNKDIVRSMLLALAADPVGTAAKHGGLTGKCCFCNKKLTDDHSLGAGFGPVCAAKYGLTGKWQGASGPIPLPTKDHTEGAFSGSKKKKEKASNTPSALESVLAVIQKKKASSTDLKDHTMAEQITEALIAGINPLVEISEAEVSEAKARRIAAPSPKRKVDYLF